MARAVGIREVEYDWVNAHPISLKALVSCKVGVGCVNIYSSMGSRALADHVWIHCRCRSECDRSGQPLQGTLRLCDKFATAYRSSISAVVALPCFTIVYMQ